MSVESLRLYLRDELVPALGRLWDHLGTLPKAADPTRRAAIVRRWVRGKLVRPMLRRHHDDLDFCLVAPAVVQQVVEKFLAGKLGPVLPPPGPG